MARETAKINNPTIPPTSAPLMRMYWRCLPQQLGVAPARRDSHGRAAGDLKRDPGLRVFHASSSRGRRGGLGGRRRRRGGRALGVDFGEDIVDARVRLGDARVRLGAVQFRLRHEYPRLGPGRSRAGSISTIHKFVTAR